MMPPPDEKRRLESAWEQLKSFASAVAVQDLIACAPSVIPLIKSQMSHTDS